MPSDRSVGQNHLNVKGVKFVLFVVSLQKFLYFGKQLRLSTWICTAEIGLPDSTRRNCVILINLTWHSDGNPLYEKNRSYYHVFFLLFCWNQV